MTKETKERSYFFDSITDLITHLKTLNPDIGPIRLQKTLYFLYAFYGATYGSLKNAEGISEINNTYPSRLFSGSFEAWQYGPVMRDVYFKNKDGDYEGLEDQTKEKYSEPREKDIINFIDGLVNDLEDMSDFALVDRTHQDKAWKSKFNENHPYESKTIDNDELVSEYVRKIAETSSI